MIEENMEIVEYSKEYDEQIKDLLVQLQEYLVKIDDLDIEILYKDYNENIRNKKEVFFQKSCVYNLTGIVLQDKNRKK